MNEIDKIFKNKLENYKEIPSAAAWNQVQAKLQKKNNNRRYLIAAAVALLLVSSLVWVNFSFDKEEQIAGNNTVINVTHPQLPNSEIANIQLPKEIEKVENLAEKRTKIFIAKQTKLKANHTSKPIEIAKPKNIQLANLEENKEKADFTPEKITNDTNVALNDEEKEIKELFEGDEETKNYPKVKITYIAAGKTLEKEQEQPRKADKLWKKIKGSSPLKIIADIRAAKERLIQGKLKAE